MTSVQRDVLLHILVALGSILGVLLAVCLGSCWVPVAAGAIILTSFVTVVPLISALSLLIVLFVVVSGPGKHEFVNFNNPPWRQR